MGYHRAGFEVVGVDIKPQPRYPFEFIQADAVEFLSEAYDRFAPFNYVEAIHASPPCQRWSTATKRNGTQDTHPDYISELRPMLLEIASEGVPYVIENVVGAPLHDPLLICGSTFGLETDGYRLKRHRHFELSWQRPPGRYCACDLARYPVMDVTGGGPTYKPRTDGGGGRPYKGTADQARRIMGIDWMTKAELNEAIPPLYTKFLGEQLLAHIGTPVG